MSRSRRTEFRREDRDAGKHGSVLQVLRSYGTQEQLDQSGELLGDPVDTDADGDLLRELGVDPEGSSTGRGMASEPLEHPDAGPGRDAPGTRAPTVET